MVYISDGQTTKDFYPVHEKLDLKMKFFFFNNLYHKMFVTTGTSH